MLNVFPKVSGVFVARHLLISYSAATDLAYTAFWNGLSMRLEVSTHSEEAWKRAVVLRDGGLSIRLERGHDHLELRIIRDDRDPEEARDLADMREVLEKVRTTVEDYQRPRRSWWAIVPTDQYSFTKFL